MAFAPSEALKGGYIDCLNREAFRIAHETSAYSFAGLAKGLRTLMCGRNTALITLSYLGAHRAIQNYNVMGPAKASLEANIRYMAADLGIDGIRVNGVSAGPIKTLAAKGIADFQKILNHVEAVAPMRRNITIAQVANVAAFLCSDLASGITGEVVYVDNGYNIIGF